MSTHDTLPALFRLDEENKCLWQGAHRIALSDKPWAVLRYLVAHGGRLISHAELQDAVWSGKRVSEANVKVQIGILRELLQDSSKQPRFIATHPGGYSFIAQVHQLAAGVHSLGMIAPLARPPSPAHLRERDNALDKLYAQLNKALIGQRQVVFVSGEAGIGKTTLIQALRDQLANIPIWVAVGQCSEHYGTDPREDYAPVLDAFGGSLARQHHAALRSILEKCAPTWLAQLPALANPDQPHGASAPSDLLLPSGSMPRELVNAIDVLTEEQAPLVLVLDDLQWSDLATLRLVAMLACRPISARFLLVGLYRPEEINAADHPLRSLLQDICAQRFCAEIKLDSFTEPEVHSLLAARFPKHNFPAQLAAVLCQRSAGNPLLLADLIETLEQRDVLSCRKGKWVLTASLDTLAGETPTRFYSRLAQHIDRLTAEERELLAAASVVGQRFAAMTVAHLLEKDVVRIEELSESLVEQGYFLLRAGFSEGREGGDSTCYRFRTQLIYEAWLSRLPAARRQRWQQSLEKIALKSETEQDGG